MADSPLSFNIVYRELSDKLQGTAFFKYSHCGNGFHRYQTDDDPLYKSLATAEKKCRVLRNENPSIEFCVVPQAGNRPWRMASTYGRDV